MIGNAGMDKAREVGPPVKIVLPAQHAIFICSGVGDRWGYPEKFKA